MSKLRAEDGMTLMEMLVAVTISFVVLAATMGLLSSTLRLTGGLMSKTDAMQRGRLAMDRVTQELRSQVCLNLTTPAIIPGATADSVTFYSDFGPGDLTKPPDKRTISFDSATGNITESIVRGTVNPDGSFNYGGTPVKSVIFENASRQTKKVGGIDQPVPFLKYFAYEETGTPPVLRTSQELVPPLTDPAKAARVARIEVAFNARPTGAKDSANATDVEDQVTVRHADPNLTVPDPMCV
jgi:type II secretory pathway pseudopilin PulG